MMDGDMLQTLLYDHHARILVTTPNTLVLASLSNIN